MKNLLFFLVLLLPILLAGQVVVDLDKTYIDSTWQSIELDTLFFAKDSTYITNGADSIKFVVDDTEVMRLIDVGGDGQAIFDPNGNFGSATNPTVAFGDGNTGFYELQDNQLGFVTAGLQRFSITASGLQYGGEANNPSISWEGNSSATVPLFHSKRDDLDTGLGSTAVDQATIIAGGVMAINSRELGGTILTTMTDTVIADVILATGTISGNTGITLDTDPTIVLAAADCRNQARFNNDADVIDYTLPAAEVGLVVLFYDIGGGVITIDPVDGTDTIYLNGTSIGAGDAIDSPGNVGDFIALMAIDATRWVTVGRSGVWVDANP